MRHHLNLTALLTAIGLTLGASSVAADTLEVPAEQSVSEERELITMEVPAKGMSTGQVTRKFGEPLEVIIPVGEPPISRWLYEDYTVYFEGDFVIHTVIH